MKKLFLIILLISSFQLMSQQLSPQVISSAGDHFSNNDISMSWTLGEPVISTLTGDYILTQGFHQDMYIVTSIDELNNIGLNIDVYPNPTPNILHIKWSSEIFENENVSIQLLDMSGKILYAEEMTTQSQINSINLNSFNRSIYLLKINYKNQTKTYKIVKN